MTTRVRAYSAYTLWGQHPLYADGLPIKLTGGTLRECDTERRWRAGHDERWSGLVVVPGSKRPWFEGDPS